VQNEVRRYLLGQLGEADQERIELRLLTDPSFGEEFDTIVDELTDQYVRNDLPGDERKRVERYFLNTPERQQKVEFATELLSHADAERGERVERAQVAVVQPVVEPSPGLLDQIRAFWRRPTFAQGGLSAAVLLVVAGLVFFLISFRNPSEYVALDLELRNSNRAVSTAPTTVQLAGAGFKVNLTIPEQAKDAKALKVKLVDENDVKRDLTIDERTDNKIKVTIPAALLNRGSYVIQLWMVKPDGRSEERVPGSYNFVVE
jgi:methionine-rich copper-binding protein CopC